MNSPLRFPTPLHREVAEVARDFFSSRAYVDTILVVNSCARGRAVAGSDLDMAVLLTPAAPSQEIQSLTMKWQQFIAADPKAHQFRSTGRFAQVHLDVFDGRMLPTVWDDGGGPDSFEIEIGNRVAYAAPFGEVGAYFRQLQSQWLPYYDEALRLSRLAMVREACARDLDAIPFFLRRGLYFQAFDRLYKAFQEFLQALFVARRTYPIAYNKWIREQVTEWLSMLELYQELPQILRSEHRECRDRSEGRRFACSSGALDSPRRSQRRRGPTLKGVLLRSAPGECLNTGGEDLARGASKYAYC
jgi:predicted nucleotidyltransferase